MALAQRLFSIIFSKAVLKKRTAINARMFSCSRLDLVLNSAVDAAADSSVDTPADSAEDGGQEQLTWSNKELKEEYEKMLVFDPYNMPWILTQSMVDILQSRATHTARSRDLYAFGKTEKKRLIAKNSRKEEQRLKLLEEKEIDSSNSSNRIMLWLRPATISDYHNHNLVYASQFGNNLLIDCGYDELYTPKMIVELVDSIQGIHNYNKVQREPFNLWLCNVSEESPLRTQLYETRLMMGKNAIINITSKSHLELFDPEDLIYLSPDSYAELSPKDLNATFVIGGLPDRGGRHPRETLAKARKEKIRHRSLPITRYIRMKGSTLLPCEAVARIIHTASIMGLESAITECIPERLHVTEDELAQHRRVSKESEERITQYKKQKSMSIKTFRQNQNKI